MDFKKVIFFTECVSGQGGNQRLISRRCRHLNALGIKTYVVARLNIGPYYLKDDFSTIPVIYLPIINKPLSLTTKRQRKEFLTQVRVFVNEIDADTIIESLSMEECVWAEYFASKMKIRHLFYTVHGLENFSRYHYYPYKKLFLFKYHRHEVAGISPYALKYSLNEAKVPSNYYLRVPFDNKELLKKTKPTLSFEREEGEMIIATISRLEKPALRGLLEDVVKTAIANPNLKLLFVVFGGTSYNEVGRMLIETYGGRQFCENLRIIFTGTIEMGEDLFKKIDIYVGVGTTVLNAASQKIPTVVSGIRDLGNSYTIFGVDTSEFYDCTDSLRKYSFLEIIERINTSSRNEFGLRAYELVNTEYTNEVYDNRLNLFLKTTMGWYPFSKCLFLWAIRDYMVYMLLKLYHSILK